MHCCIIGHGSTKTDDLEMLINGVREAPLQDKKCPGMTSGLLHKEQSLKVTVKHGRNFD